MQAVVALYVSSSSSSRHTRTRPPAAFVVAGHELTHLHRVQPRLDPDAFEDLRVRESVPATGLGLIVREPEVRSRAIASTPTHLYPGPLATTREESALTSIMQLLNQVAEDQVVLPAIQRDFVWSEEQTEMLLDSIMRGYPIGIALLWETYNDIQYRAFARDFRFGTLHSYRDNPDGRRLRIVLDGQQRLQSLFIALHGQRDGRSAYFDVLSGQQWDDSDQERFLFDFLDAATAEKANRNTEAEAVRRAADDDYGVQPRYGGNG